MSTPIWMTGLEHGVVSIRGGDTAGAGGIFDEMAGTGSISRFSADTVTKRSGSYALKGLWSSNNNAMVRKRFASQNVVVVHFAVRLDALPAEDIALFGFQITPPAGGQNHPFLFYKQSTNKWAVGFNTSDSPDDLTTMTNVQESAATVAAGQWYSIELRFTVNVNPRTVDWRIDQVAQTQASIAQAASTCSGLQLGALGDNLITVTAWWDDIVVSASSADYPLGDRNVKALVPGAMGTNSGEANFAEDDGTAIDANSWNRLDEIPPTLNDFVKQVTASGTSYLEIAFGNTAAADQSLGGVWAIVAGHDVAGGINDAESRIRRSDGTETVIHDGDSFTSSTLLDYKGKIVTAPAGGWTRAEVDALLARLGFSTDVTPVPAWDALVLEYDVEGNVAPNAPILVSPTNGVTVDLVAGYTFDWTFSDPNTGDSQSAWYIRRKIGAGAYEYYNGSTGSWQSTEVKNVAIADQFVFGSGKWASNTTYNWSVATEDSFGLKGLYAADSTVTSSGPPTVTITEPSGSSPTTRPTVSWSLSDPEGDPQQTYDVRVESGAYGTTPGSGTAVWSSGEVANAATRSVVVGSDLVNGTTHRVFVRSQAGSQYSAWAFSTFTISLDPPAVPTIGVTVDNSNARNSIAVQGRDNLLSVNAASIETDATDWAADLNQAATYPQRSVAQAAHGQASLLVRSGAAGDMRVRMASRVAVMADKQYTVLAEFRAATDPRSVRVIARWYDAAVGGTLLRTDIGTTVADTTTGWTAAPALTVTSPAGATHLEIALEVLATGAANEDHYTDKISAAPGPLATWTRGGLTGIHRFIVEYQDGVNWKIVRDAGAVIPDSAANQQATVYDYESTPKAARNYRAKTTAEV